MLGAEFEVKKTAASPFDNIWINVWDEIRIYERTQLCSIDHTDM